ncbi:unnamed protein product [Gadus morhua 'NCC']
MSELDKESGRGDAVGAGVVSSPGSSDLWKSTASPRSSAQRRRQIVPGGRFVSSHRLGGGSGVRTEPPPSSIWLASEVSRRDVIDVTLVKRWPLAPPPSRHQDVATFDTKQTSAVFTSSIRGGGGRLPPFRGSRFEPPSIMTIDLARHGREIETVARETGHVSCEQID